MRDFNDKVAVITGGASGIGRAIASALVGEGAHVVVADIDAEAVARTAAELSGRGRAVLGVVVDVTQPSDVEALGARVLSAHETVHLLFANAGVGVTEARRRLWTLPEADWRWAYEVNVMGVVRTLRAFVPAMLARGQEGAVVVTTSGNGGLTSLPATPIYASSKAAVTSLTEVLHQQLLQEGARLTAHLLFPGPNLVNTNILSSHRVRPEAWRAPGEAPPPHLDMKAMAASAGVAFQLTEPEEVATMALEGVREGRFWILSRQSKGDDAVRERAQSILDRENPRRR